MVVPTDNRLPVKAREVQSSARLLVYEAIGLGHDSSGCGGEEGGSMELYIVLGDGIRPPTAGQTEREKRELQSLERPFHVSCAVNHKPEGRRCTNTIGE